MTTVGLLFRFEASSGKEEDVARFLEDGFSAVLHELPTTAWFAVRFGRTSFGIFDAFPDQAGQVAHIGERLAEALQEQDTLLAATPIVEGFDVLAFEASTDGAGQREVVAQRRDGP